MFPDTRIRFKRFCLTSHFRGQPAGAASGSWGVAIYGARPPMQTPEVQPSGANLRGPIFGAQPLGPNLRGPTFGVQSSGPNLRGPTLGAQPSGPNLRGPTFRAQPSGPNLQGPTFGAPFFLLFSNL